MNVEMLTELYQQRNGKKAVGIDKVDKDAYGERLTENLTDLIRRIRRGIYRPQPSYHMIIVIMDYVVLTCCEN